LETEDQLDVRLDVPEFHCKWPIAENLEVLGFMRAFCFGILEGEPCAMASTLLQVVMLLCSNAQGQLDGEYRP
jgi:hypothetical protein